MQKRLKRMIIITFSVILLFGISVFLFLQHPKFGQLPSGERLERINKSPNFRNGIFHNQSLTTTMTDGANFFSVIGDFIKSKNRKPKGLIPSTKTDLLDLDSSEDVLVWFGHSSYFIQIDGKKILVDPVFSGSVSPISFTNRAFKGTDRYTTDDMPFIDYLFISHDHWDHLDYETILKLKPKIGAIICGLGTGQHFEYWGFDKTKIIEKDWYEEATLDDGFKASLVPARHFTGRGFTANKTLWTAFALQTPTFKLYIGGDGGYDKHFAEAGKTFGEFDLAILENGQYNNSWKHIHMMPEQVLQAAKDLNAKRLFPVHSSKFALSVHAWDAPLETITQLNADKKIPIITPIIGEKVLLKNNKQKFLPWWKSVKQQ